MSKNPADGAVYWITTPEFAEAMKSKIDPNRTEFAPPPKARGRFCTPDGGYYAPPRPLRVCIKRLADGEVRTITEEPSKSWGYAWSDGNFGCDCNREIMFDNKDDRETEEECGESRYAVRIFDAETGEMLYDEWEASK